MKRTPVFAISFILVAAASFAADPYPAGSIAFFNLQGCPAGWSTYTPLIGRTVLPSPPEYAGEEIHSPLLSNSQLSHTHPFDASVSLGGVSYAVVSGCCNEGLTSEGKKTATGVTDAANGNLPYVQLMSCQKNEAPSDAQKPPANVLVFTASKSGCGSGWAYASRLNGRLIVGLPTGGTAEASFGGNALAPDGVAPSHTHTISSPLVTFKPYGVTAAKGGTGGYGKKGDYTATGTAGIAAIFMPLVKVVPCQAQ